MASAERMYGVPLTAVSQLRHILNTMLAQVDFACVYLLSNDSLQELAKTSGVTLSTTAQQALDCVVLDALEHEDPQFYLVSEAELSETPFHSALLLPLLLEDEIIGALTLFSYQSQFYTHERGDALEATLSLTQMVVQNLVLDTRLQAANLRIERQQDDTMTSRLAVLDAIADSVIILIPMGESARVMTVNTRFSTLFGISNSEAKTLTLDALLDLMRIPRNVRQDLAEVWFSIPVLSTETQEGEFEIPGLSGAALDIKWYSGPIMQQERVRGRIYTFHDVTSENAAARLRAAWLQRVSHELRTPLTSISGFAQFILEETGDKLPDLAREYTEIILNSARHLNRVFSGMIEISRADAGELSLHRSEAHIPDVIIETIARLEFQYKEHGLKVVMELDDDLPHVMIDVDRVSQVLTHILNNAIQCSPSGGRIRVSTKGINKADDLPASAPADVIFPSILVSVTDQGNGLATEEVEKVFEPFYRTGYARANMVEGSGLGLTLARSFIEAHRGKIWAEAATKRRGQGGGRFFFILPQ